MKKEIYLFTFSLNAIDCISFISMLTSYIYRNTGNKASVEFNGSKGYLSNIVISCEGYQKFGENTIWVERMMTKKGGLMKKEVSLFYSDDNGIRVAIGLKKDVLIKLQQQKLASAGL